MRKILVTALTATALVTAWAVPAQAGYPNSGSVPGGSATFIDDMSDGIPVDDGLKVCDSAADGLGIEAKLIINGVDTGERYGTRGFSSPYCTKWTGLGLAEETYFRIELCQVKGTWEGICTSFYAKA